MTSLADDLRRELSAQGVALVGFADLTPLPAAARDGLPRAVCFALALDPRVIAGIADGPTPEYFEAYKAANMALNDLCARVEVLLQAAGARATGIPATVATLDPLALRTRLPHKTVATRAGLGWVGKCALLITREYGSAVRMATVLTDAELPVGAPIETSQCGDCRACVDACPARAATGVEWRVGMAREAFFDAQACLAEIKAAAQRAGIRGTVCGRCITACPWTQKYIRGMKDEARART